MSHPVFRFGNAITRAPAASAVNGLRAVDTGTPDIGRMQADHADYVATLRETGADVTVLPALKDYPDSLFVEDAALCLPEGAVLLRPGTNARAGEVAAIAPALCEAFETVLEVKGPGTIEGGDILTTAREILVGLSARTTAEGAAELAELVRPWNYKVRVLETPPGVLHFKTDCALLDEETILTTRRLEVSGCFRDYRIIHTADGEEAAANAIRFNDLVLMPAGFGATADRLRAAGYDVREIGNGECAKLDGGMSCLSLRF
ncbi:MAG: dimethylarginine dimethylaminohydrolase family protein [Paracoccaceae bacterium]